MKAFRNSKVKKIARFDKTALLGLNSLLKQWSKKKYQITPAYFKKLAAHSHILALYDGKTMIGTVTLIPLYKLSGVKGSIEHLIVDEKYRGRGLGKKLMQGAIDLAKKLNMDAIFLTCEPERKVANALYKKLGFKTKDTYFYSLEI
ncbi:MAG: GNAT family N-acetyltransferase [bacterium]|nr:GNAT family N-acetyltransferase [bacterium]